MGHSILVIAWHLLDGDCDYAELGGDFFVRRDSDRARQRAVAGTRFGGDAYGNSITGNDAGGTESQATPQGRVRGNTMPGNTGGNSVGTYRTQFRPTARCRTP